MSAVCVSPETLLACVDWDGKPARGNVLCVTLYSDAQPHTRLCIFLKELRSV